MCCEQGLRRTRSLLNLSPMSLIICSMCLLLLLVLLVLVLVVGV